MEQIDGTTKVYAILGQPIRQTLSPVMYNAAFSALGYKGVYIACAVPENGLAEAVQGIRALNIRGGNVTIPFKEKIIPYLDGVTAEARLIGAVNTLFWEQDKLLGANTDGAGFLKALQQIEPDVLKFPGAVILGAGGAARAVAVTLALAGLKEIFIVNRDKGKATSLVATLTGLGCSAQVIEWENPMLTEILTRLPLLINTTPLGMAPADQGLPPLNYSGLSSQHLVVDLIYKPGETLFLQKAKAQGCRTMNGLGMLLEQGVLSFRLWSGQEAPATVMAKALERWL